MGHVLMDSYEVCFENCEVMEIPAKEVLSFMATGVSESTYSGERFPNEVTNKVGKSVQLVIKYDFACKKFCGFPKVTSNISNLERLSYGDVVTITSSWGSEFAVPWDDDFSEQLNGTQKVTRVNEFLEKDDNGNYISVSFDMPESLNYTTIKQDGGIRVNSDKLGSHDLTELLENFDSRIKALENNYKNIALLQANSQLSNIKEKISELNSLVSDIRGKNQ